MRKVSVVLVLFALVVLAGVGYGLYQRMLLRQYDLAYDALDAVLAKALQDEKMATLSLALAVTKNRALAEAVIERDGDFGDRALRDVVGALKRHLGQEYIYVQLIVPGPRVLARSWSGEGGGIKGACDDIEMVATTGRPVVTLSSREPAGIKALVPLGYAGATIAIVEVSTLFDDLIRRGREYGVEIVPLFLDRKKAERGDAAPYRIVSKNSSKSVISVIESLGSGELEELLERQYLVKGDLYLAAFEARDFANRDLGYFIVATGTERARRLAGASGGLFERIFAMGSDERVVYESVRSGSEDPYSALDARTMLRIRDMIDSHDRLRYREALRRHLEQLTKDELVGLILGEGKTKKEGRIE